MDVDLITQINDKLKEMNDLLAKQGSVFTGQVNAINNSVSSTKNLFASMQNISNSQKQVDSVYTGVSKKSEAAAKAFSVMDASAAQLTKALSDGGTAVLGFANTMLDTTPGLTKYTRSVTDMALVVSDFAAPFGLLGKAAGGMVAILGTLVGASFKYSDAAVKSYDEISKAGAGIGESADSFLKLAHQANLSSQNMGILSKGVTELGDKLLFLGSTTSKGVETYAKMASFNDKTLKQYRNLGFTQQDLIESQEKYLELQALSGADMRKSPQELQKASLEWIDQQNELAELTGINAKTQQEALAKALTQANFQAYITGEEQKKNEASKRGDTALAAEIEQRIKVKKEAAAYAEATYGAVKATAILQGISTDGATVIGQNQAALMRGGQNVAEYNEMLNKGQSVVKRMSSDNVNAIDQYRKNYGEMGQAAGEASRNMMKINMIDTQSIAAAGRDSKLKTTEGKKQQTKEEQEAAATLEREKKYNGEIMANRGQQEQYERQIRQALDPILGKLSDQINVLVLKLQPMITKVVGLISKNMNYIIDVAKGLAVTFGIMFGAVAVGKVVGSVRTFKDGFSKWKKGESGAVGSANNAAWVVFDEKSEALSKLSGGGGGGTSGIPKVRKADLLDKNGKVLQGAALDERMKKLARKQGLSAHEKTDEKGPGGAIGDLVDVLKDASKNATSIVLGGGALAAAMAEIGAGAALATWFVGLALPTFAEGMKKFNDVDGDNLEGVGFGLAGIGTGLLLMSGSAIFGILTALSKITGGKSPLENAADELLRFQKLKLDTKKIKDNGEAALAFSLGLASVSVSDTFAKFAQGLGDFFSKKPPFKDFVDFSKLKIDSKAVKSNAEAFRTFSEAMNSYKGPDTVATITTALADSVNKYFNVRPPLEKFMYFSNLPIKAKQAKENALAFKYFSEAMSDYKGTGAGVIQALSQLAGSEINKLFGVKGPIDSFEDFTKRQFGPNAEKNADAFFKFASAMGILTGSPSASGVAGAAASGVVGAIGGALSSGATILGAAAGAAADWVSSVFKLGKPKPEFVGVMQIAKKSGDPHPEITAAQWALESGWGKHMSGKNNPFGQKAKKDKSGNPTEPATSRRTREVIGGKEIFINDYFKDYPTQDAAIAEHAQKWTARRTQPGSSPIEAATAIKAAGYATDPNYVKSLAGIVASNGIDPKAPLKAAKGGIFDGPMSGYPMELHGHEIIIPLEKDSILKKMSEKEFLEEMSEEAHHFKEMFEEDIKKHAKYSKSSATKIVEMETEMKETMLEKLDRMITVLDSRHNTSKKILQNSRV